MKERLVMQHIPSWLILTVVTQHQFQDEAYHGPGPGALNCNPSRALIGQSWAVPISYWSLNIAPGFKLKLQSPDNSPNPRHQRVAAQDTGLLCPIMTQ